MRFCWHQWGKWIDGTATFTSILFAGEREGNIQIRRCAKCNKVQTRIP